MEILDTRASSGNKPDALPVEINGSWVGFVPAYDRVLIKRLPPPPEGAVIKPQIAQEQAERGIVIAVGESKIPLPPIGAIAKFSKFAEETHFDDEDEDSYVLPWANDIRGWHLE